MGPFHGKDESETDCPGKVRSYEAPQVTFEEELEVITASCTGGSDKTSVTACPSGTIQS